MHTTWLFSTAQWYGNYQNKTHRNLKLIGKRAGWRDVQSSFNMSFRQFETFMKTGAGLSWPIPRACSSSPQTFAVHQQPPVNKPLQYILPSVAAFCLGGGLGFGAKCCAHEGTFFDGIGTGNRRGIRGELQVLFVSFF